MIPVQITCRDFPCTESISTAVGQHVEKLEKFSKKILRCEVVLDRDHQHHRHGQIFHVQIHLHLARKHIIVNRESELNHAHEDFSVALRDSFRSARRKLEDEVQVRRGLVKRHTAIKRKQARDLTEQVSEA